MSEGRRAVIIAISGCSSSGKTTLARVLRDIFPKSFILHEDDFYKPEDELPVKDGLVDWDCPEAIAVPDMERSLAYIRAEGSLPPELDSKEDQNSVGPCPISQAKIQGLKDEVDSWLQPGEPGHDIFSDKSLNICILDGFLLYCREMETVMPLIDLKLFLLVSRAKATQRRKARDGYVTLEGFWKDPPGYVDQIVWPNYVKAHKWLFEGDDVEGQLRRDRLSESGIHAQLDKGIDIDIEETLDWAVHVIMQELGRIAGDVGGRST